MERNIMSDLADALAKMTIKESLLLKHHMWKEHNDIECPKCNPYGAQAMFGMSLGATSPAYCSRGNDASFFMSTPYAGYGGRCYADLMWEGKYCKLKDGHKGKCKG